MKPRWVWLLLLLAAADHHRHRAPPKPATLGAALAAVSLAGPCVAYGYRSTPSSPGVILGLSGDGLLPSRAGYKQLRESAIYDACAPAPLQIIAGELLDQHLDQDTADPVIALTYTARDGPWRINLGAGLLYQRYGNKPAKPPVHLHFFGLFPFFGIQVSGHF